jgi:hypothetical protein
MEIFLYYRGTQGIVSRRRGNIPVLQYCEALGIITRGMEIFLHYRGILEILTRQHGNIPILLENIFRHF